MSHGRQLAPTLTPLEPSDRAHFGRRPVDVIVTSSYIRPRPMAAHRWAHARRDTPATQARRRKYNSREHRAAYADYKRRQARGEWLTCWRTGHLIPPTERCHVGHDDHDVDLIRGPECAEHNIKAAARKGNRVARARKVPVQTAKRSQSRAW